MEDAVPRALSVRSGSTRSRLSVNSMERQEEVDEDEVIQEEKYKMYVAVGKEVQEWTENLMWLFKNYDKDLMTIVFLHVHQPAQRIPTPIGPMLEDAVEQKKVTEFRQSEKEKMDECLKKYVDICAKNNFNAITRSKDSDDIAKGLLELIREHNVTDLVMGAGSAKGRPIFSNSKAKEKKPKSKIAITVGDKADPSCRIHFISRRELICIREPNQNASDASNFSRSSSGSSSDHSVQLQHMRSYSMPPSKAKQAIGPSGLDQNSRSVNAGAPYATRDLDPSSYKGFEDQFARTSSSSPLHQNLVSEFNYLQKKSELEDTFARQCTELENTKKMYEQAQHELIKINELLSSIDLQNMRLRQTVASLQTKFEETNALVEKIAQEREAALRKVQEFVRHGSSSHHLVNCTEFTYTDIKEATKNFDPSYKIGDGGFGTVYKGFLRHTTVAIKIMNRDSTQGDPQFYQEIEILSRNRHPHLVILMGACFEARALVYEYVALGSLDKHLIYKDQTRPLPWEVRARVALEVCSALMFLHSSGVVHGDLKPENILLDSNYTVKLSDMGICRHVHMTNTATTPYHITEQPKGTFPYMDPEYLSSGELTPQYDVFSFGIVLLQLVTGKEAKRLKNDMEEAIENQKIEKMIDASAGWPPEQAIKMIQIGMWCSDRSRRKRPDLAKDVWRFLESIANVASTSMMRPWTMATS